MPPSFAAFAPGAFSLSSLVLGCVAGTFSSPGQFYLPSCGFFCHLLRHLLSSVGPESTGYPVGSPCPPLSSPTGLPFRPGPGHQSRIPQAVQSSALPHFFFPTLFPTLTGDANWLLPPTNTQPLPLDPFYMHPPRVRMVTNIEWGEMLLLLLTWPPVREVCPNHEVVIFQPWTGTSPDLGSTAYCYVVILYDPPRLIFLMPDDSMRGQTNTACTIMPYPSSKYVPA